MKPKATGLIRDGLCGIVLLIAGCTVMTGWLLKQPLWPSVATGRLAMVFCTALCFAVSGLALALSSVNRRIAMPALASAGVVVSVIAAAMLVENLLAVDLGIDLAGLHRWFADVNPSPGRMAPNTALALLAAGVAMLISPMARMTPLRRTLAAVATTTGLLGMAGDAFLLDLAYDWFGIPRMAIPSGLGIVLLGGALVAGSGEQAGARDGGMARGEANIYAFLGVAVTILASVVAVSYGSIRALEDRSDWVKHTYEVRAQFEELASL
jgi:hypothetical protein